MQYAASSRSRSTDGQRSPLTWLLSWERRSPPCFLTQHSLLLKTLRLYSPLKGLLENDQRRIHIMNIQLANMRFSAYFV